MTAKTATEVLKGYDVAIIGKDEWGRNIYELRGPRGAHYVSERSPLSPNCLVFIQARTHAHGKRIIRDKMVSFGFGLFHFTDIDGPLMTLVEAGLVDSSGGSTTYADPEYKIPPVTAIDWF